MSLGTSILFRSLDARSLGVRSFLSCAVVPEEFSLSVPRSEEHTSELQSHA